MSNWTDVIGGANFYGGVRTSFTYDRFNMTNQAISLNDGYILAPIGVYFNDDFSFTAWINLRAMRSQMSIIDFGNGASYDNFLIQTGLDPKRFCVDIYNLFSSSWSSSQYDNYCFSSNINLNKWYHVAFVLNYGIGSFFLDGLRIGSGRFFSPRGETRFANLIGKSNRDPNKLYADAIYDDFKIYDGALNDDEILNDYSNFF